eukprot:1134217-Pelagomonas_calceolata.AAC.1
MVSPNTEYLGSLVPMRPVQQSNRAVSFHYQYLVLMRPVQQSNRALGADKTCAAAQPSSIIDCFVFNVMQRSGKHSELQALMQESQEAKRGSTSGLSTSASFPVFQNP